MCEDKPAIMLAERATSQGDHDCSDRDIKSAELFCDFMYKSLVETVNLIKQGTLYYFIIVAATNSFLLAASSPYINEKYVLYATALISVFYLVIMVAMAWGIIQGLTQLSESYQALNSKIYAQLKLDSYFKRGIVIGIITFAMCTAILITLVIGFYFQYFRGVPI